MLSTRDFKSLQTALTKELASASVTVAVIPAILEELVINESDPTATAKELAAMFMARLKANATGITGTARDRRK
jgi:hypothetical protein